jgi:hypothetical protein
LFIAEILIAKSVVCTVVGIAFWNLGFVDFFGKRDSSESLQRRKSEELQNKIEKKKKKKKKERRIGDSHLQKLRKLGEGSWEWSH